MNSYFQFENQNDGLYLNLHFIAGSTRQITMDDIIHYADKAKISDCDLAAVKTALTSGKDAKIKVGTSCMSSNEWGEYRISSDCLRVEAIFYPPFVGASKLSAEEIIKDLATTGVKFGIKDDFIKGIVANMEYFTPFEVAHGVEPINGEDALITYLFETQKVAKPKIKDDGTVDYHDMDNLNHVKKGDVLAVMKPDVPGTAGTDIFGRSIAPNKAKRLVFKYGRNISVAPDGLSIVSDVDGHVTLEGDKVFVSNVLELVNVDASTGDINYEGNVKVSGNVQAGFSIKASGNVDVNGIVEGATIEAGGNLTLVRGVQGMGKAVLICGGNLVAKFIESAQTVTVGGSIDCDTILHSTVEARGTITVEGKNGLIIGGDVRSTTLINARFIGNEMGTATTVGVGVNPSEKRKMEVLKKEIVELNQSKAKLSQIVTVLRKKQEMTGELEPDKQEMLQKTTRNMLLMEKDMIQKRNELDNLTQLVSEDVNARIKVGRTMYTGVKVVFGDTYIFIKNKYDYCQFVKSGADIKSIPM